MRTIEQIEYGINKIWDEQQAIDISLLSIDTLLADTQIQGRVSRKTVWYKIIAKFINRANLSLTTNDIESFSLRCQLHYRKYGMYLDKFGELLSSKVVGLTPITIATSGWLKSSKTEIKRIKNKDEINYGIMKIAPDLVDDLAGEEVYTEKEIIQLLPDDTQKLITKEKNDLNAINTDLLTFTTKFGAYRWKQAHGVNDWVKALYPYWTTIEASLVKDESSGTIPVNQYIMTIYYLRGRSLKYTGIIDSKVFQLQGINMDEGGEMIADNLSVWMNRKIIENKTVDDVIYMIQSSNIAKSEENIPRMNIKRLRILFTRIEYKKMPPIEESLISNFRNDSSELKPIYIVGPKASGKSAIVNQIIDNKNINKADLIIIDSDDYGQFLNFVLKHHHEGFNSQLPLNKRISIVENYWAMKELGMINYGSYINDMVKLLLGDEITEMLKMIKEFKRLDLQMRFMLKWLENAISMVDAKLTNNLLQLYMSEGWSIQHFQEATINTSRFKKAKNMVQMFHITVETYKLQAPVTMLVMGSIFDNRSSVMVRAINQGFDAYDTIVELILSYYYESKHVPSELSFSQASVAQVILASLSN